MVIKQRPAAPPSSRALLATGVTPRRLAEAGGPLVLESAEGAWVTDVSGKRYLDAASGYFTASVGYGRSSVAAAVAAQLERLSYAPLDWRAHGPALELAEHLLALAPGMERVFFCSGGSEAVDTALKLARLTQRREGGARTEILYRPGSYHGATLGATSVTGLDELRAPYGPLLGGVRAVERPEDPAALGQAAAFIAEPVPAANRVRVPKPGFWPAVRRATDTSGALWIADEVLTGIGRTGRWLALEHWECRADLVLLGKGLSGGYAPLAAVLVGPRVAAALEDEPFDHGYTFGGHPASCAAALEVLRIIEAEGLIEASARQGASLLRGLKALAARLPGAGPVEGLGLLASVGLRLDGAARQRLERALLRRGLIAYVSEEGVTLAPPLNFSDAELASALERLEEGLRE
ncbi:MAG: class III aminotransferase [Elusimicrobia bacterium]|nr:MAG: class III aminotransferase [Elusimicrobiota bacterium]